MDKYTVRFYPEALRKIEQMYKTIAIDKSAPENASNWIGRLNNKILSLEYMPNRHQDRSIGRYGNKGYKQFVVEKHLVVYKVLETEKLVDIITVEYCGG